MPLHLLGKKSWNVYNADNIAKVKRDEASAKAREEAEEQQMQVEDAERRIKILRGEDPGPEAPLPSRNDADDQDRRSSRAKGSESRKRHRDEFEEAAARQDTSHRTLKMVSSDKPLVDHAGHIDLFPQKNSSKGVENNAEAEAEAKKKREELEAQYQVRFADAAGFKQGLSDPWYSKKRKAKDRDDIEDAPGKDVWGNQDPRRKDRGAARIVADDPLAAMRKGAAAARNVEKERKRQQEAWKKEMDESLEVERHKSKRKRRHRDKNDVDNEDSLEGFSLDRPARSPSRDEHRHKRRHRHRSSHGSHRHRSREPDRRRTFH